MILKATQVLRTALSALALSAAATAAPVAAFAQDAAAQAPGGPGAPPLGWFKTCSKQGESDICVVQNLIATQNQLITAVGLITVEGKVNQKIMQVSVPTARLIPPGIAMQIDGGKAQKIDYVVCLPDKCTAEVPLTDAMLSSLKKGNEVTFTSINFRRAPNPIKIPLTGFSGAFDGPAMPQEKIAQSQRTLEEGLQKKAEETRKKLEDAQNAAKQGN